jgi:hypothetical protein
MQNQRKPQTRYIFRQIIPLGYKQDTVNKPSFKTAQVTDVKSKGKMN